MPLEPALGKENATHDALGQGARHLFDYRRAGNHAPTAIFRAVFAAFVKERLTRAVVSLAQLLAQLLAGLFLIVAHNVWSPVPAAIITLIAWLAVVEASLYLLLPDDMLEGFIRTFNTPSWYIFGGLLAIIVASGSRRSVSGGFSAALTPKGS